MKKLVVFIIAAFSLMSCGTAVMITDSNRTVNNFTYTNGSLTWTEVFQMSDSTAVRDWFASNFTIKQNDPAKIIGETPQSALPVSESGLDRMSVAMLLTHPCIVYFTTDFKQDRYRVTVNKIIWYPQVGITTYGVTQGVGTMALSEVAVKDGGYKSAFYNTSSKHLDQILRYLFTARIDNQNNNDNW